jgi:hypothetical protein
MVESVPQKFAVLFVEKYPEQDHVQKDAERDNQYPGIDIVQGRGKQSGVQAEFAGDEHGRRQGVDHPEQQSEDEEERQAFKKSFHGAALLGEVIIRSCIFLVIALVEPLLVFQLADSMPFPAQVEYEIKMCNFSML